MNTHQQLLRPKQPFVGIQSFLVGSSGFEPPTLRLSGARSNHLSYEPILMSRFLMSRSSFLQTLCVSPAIFSLGISLCVDWHFEYCVVIRVLPFICHFGGDEGNRSRLRARSGLALTCPRHVIHSQPVRFRTGRMSSFSLYLSRLVEMKGIEPLTPCLQGRCSPS